MAMINSIPQRYRPAADTLLVVATASRWWRISKTLGAQGCDNLLCLAMTGFAPSAMIRREVPSTEEGATENLLALLYSPDVGDRFIARLADLATQYKVVLGDLPEPVAKALQARVEQLGDGSLVLLQDDTVPAHLAEAMGWTLDSGAEEEQRQVA